MADGNVVRMCGGSMADGSFGSCPSWERGNPDVSFLLLSCTSDMHHSLSASVKHIVASFCFPFVYLVVHIKS